MKMSTACDGQLRLSCRGTDAFSAKGTFKFDFFISLPQLRGCQLASATISTRYLINFIARSISRYWAYVIRSPNYFLKF